MSRNSFHWRATAVLALPLLLAACPQRGGQGGTTATSTASAGTVSRFDADTTLTAPQRRYRALLPLLRAVQEGKERTALPFAETAGQVGVSEAELRLWYDLYDNLGRTGLITPAEPSVPDMAGQMVGTWNLSGRKIEGKDAVVSAEIHIKSVETSATKAVLEMLILEEGILHSWAHSGTHGNDQPFTIGSFFNVTLSLNPESKSVVDVDLNGEVWGENYPGLEKPTTVRVLQDLVRLGETYTAVRAGDVVAGNEEALKVVGKDVWNYVNGVDGMALSYGAFEYDTYDTNLKVTREPMIDEPRAYWTRLREANDVAMLRPQRQEEIRRIAPHTMPSQPMTAATRTGGTATTAGTRTGGRDTAGGARAAGQQPAARPDSPRTQNRR